MRATFQARPQNLTTDVQNAQLRVGVVIFAIALTGAVLVREFGIVSPLRYLLFVPFLLGLHGLHMGLTGVCGLSAALGVRHTAEGSEPVCDCSELHEVRKRGALILASTAATAMAVTLTLLH